jgi:mRNA interferase MazF
MNLRRGDVWLADLGLAAKRRPVVIVSRDDPDPPRALVVYVPLTTQNRGSAYEVKIPKVRFLDTDSVANVQGIGSLPTVRLERKLGKLPDGVMTEIRRAILFALDLET